jgi:hypothetical protein
MRPTKACKRPCHDCPFRTDILRYQSYADVASNITSLLNARGITACHQTTTYNGDHVAVEVPGKQPHACAGFLTMVSYVTPLYAGYRLIEYEFDPAHHNVPIYPSIEAFLHSPCPDQSPDARRLAWLQNQPKGKRDRLIKQLP